MAAKKSDSKPVGFRLKATAHGVYSSLAAADRDRPVGTLLAIVLEAVTPLAALLETDRSLSVDEVLRRAGLDAQAAAALSQHSPKQEAQG